MNFRILRHLIPTVLLFITVSFAQAAQPSVPISGYNDAEKFVTALKAKYPQGGTSVEILHLKGQERDPNLDILENELTKANFTPIVLELEEADFDAEAKKLADETYGKSYALDYASSAPEVIEKRGFKTRLKSAIQWLFSLKKGITLAASRDPKGEYHRLGATTAVWGTICFAASTIYQGIDFGDAHFMAAAVLLTGWIYAFTRYSREWNEIKKNGGYFLFMGKSVIRDIVLQLGLVYLTAAAFNPGVAIGTGAWIVTAIKNGILSAYSYTPVERIRVKLDSRATDLRAEGNEEEALKLERRSRNIVRLYYMIVFPIISNLNLLASTKVMHNPLVMAAPLLIAGTIGMVMDLWKSGRSALANIFSSESRDIGITSCNDIMRNDILRVKLPQLLEALPAQ